LDAFYARVAKGLGGGYSFSALSRQVGQSELLRVALRASPDDVAIYNAILHVRIDVVLKEAFLRRLPTLVGEERLMFAFAGWPTLPDGGSAGCLTVAPERRDEQILMRRKGLVDFGYRFECWRVCDMITSFLQSSSRCWTTSRGNSAISRAAG